MKWDNGWTVMVLNRRLAPCALCGLEKHGLSLLKTLFRYEFLFFRLQRREHLGQSNSSSELPDHTLDSMWILVAGSLHWGLSQRSCSPYVYFIARHWQSSLSGHSQSRNTEQIAISVPKFYTKTFLKWRNRWWTGAIGSLSSGCTTLWKNLILWVVAQMLLRSQWPPR